MTGRSAPLLVRATSGLASLLLVYVTLHTLIEIGSRTLLGRSSGVLVEFAGYALAAMTFLALSDTMRSGSLVRVNLLLNFVPRGVRRALDALCLAATLGVTAFVAWFVWIDMRRSFLRDIETDSVIPLPAWLPPAGLLLGLVMFTIDVAWHLILVLRGKYQIRDGVQHI